MSEKEKEDKKKDHGLSKLIEEQYVKDRKVFLWGGVDDESAKHVIDRLLYLDAKDPGKDITLIINSPGGYVTSGFAVYDTMKSLKSPVSTVCMGLAASMGSILLSAGEKGKRFIYPLAKVMIHQPSGGARGQSTDIEIQANEILKTKQIGAEILAENCGQTVDKILKDFNRDYWMNADESLKYGIVDKIMKY
ncbi:MAG TPA: ATP-dependent Clp protease proteolytic subunit [Cryomorphaceae bacterium]|nr:ATP-dependent Clp protease proteolytic subunit [Cryomorphaceae bacterium]